MCLYALGRSEEARRTIIEAQEFWIAMPSTVKEWWTSAQSLSMVLEMGNTELAARCTLKILEVPDGDAPPFITDAHQENVERIKNETPDEVFQGWEAQAAQDTELDLAEDLVAFLSDSAD